ncbi:MAG: HupF/HypC family [Solirubrobacteraceae bacterium]|nr:HupF/HypC family [Solirubrobacteraceae bacterium]
MTPSPAPSYACTGEHCITCSDEGVPMIVLGAARGGLALCADQEGRTHTVETTLLEAAPVGGRVLVHADVAIAALPREFGR